MNDEPDAAVASEDSSSGDSGANSSSGDKESPSASSPAPASGTQRRRSRGGRGRSTSRRPEGTATQSSDEQAADSDSDSAGTAEASGEGKDEATETTSKTPARSSGNPSSGTRSSGTRSSGTRSSGTRFAGGSGSGRPRRPRAAPKKPQDSAVSADAPADEPKSEADEPEAESSQAAPGPVRRRRRRGGRGRSRSGSGASGGGRSAAEDSAEGVEAPTEDSRGSGATEADASAEPVSSPDSESKPGRPSRNRRSRSRSGRAKKPAEDATGDGDSKTGSKAGSKDDSKTEGKKTSKRTSKKDGPTRTRTGARSAGRNGSSTRMAPRTRSRRRRVEALPLFKRTTGKTMVITENGDRDQIAVLEDRDLVQHFITRAGAHSMVGNIYKARVQNVLPGMEAAFLDVGRGRNAVLYAGEVNYDDDVEGEAPRIENALKNGQAVMVQVTKDPLGGKGARLTAQVSLPGRYLVLVPNAEVFGISRRLEDEERKRLRAAVKEIRPEGHGIIVRTAAEGASEEALAADVERLIAEWASIEKRAKRAKAPSSLYEEPELTVRVVRDLFNDEEFKELATDSQRIYDRVTEYLREIAPDLVEKVKLHQGPLPVFEEYHVLEQIHKALDRKVWLPSGGYLVIDRSEALTVIDVNTGKSVGKTNLEETVVGTNVEAAEEVARQLRLRDIGGMIIIDFIDMIREENKRKVIDTLKEALSADKTRSQVFDISPLGLLEMTRKRVSAGLLESFSETCPTCEGRGILLTLEI